MKSTLKNIFIRILKKMDFRPSSELFKSTYDIQKEWQKSGKVTPLTKELKQAIIRIYAKDNKFRIFVESGTYLGLMVSAQANFFERIYSIELDNDLFEKATEKFKDLPHIKIIHGDSGIVMHDLIKTINQPAIFWLDGHYSGDITAKGDKECPILEELAAILSGEKHNHILLIDDARLFNGTHDYPTIEAVKIYILKVNPTAIINVDFDMIICQLKY